MSLSKRRQSSRLNQGTLANAVENGRISEVKAILLQGVSVHSRYILDRTPLHIATSAGHEAVIDLLLQFGALVCDLDAHDNTPLHFVAENGNSRNLQKLLAASIMNGGPANINARNFELETPLHSAAYMGQGDIIKYMVKYGADVNARKRDSGTALHLAASIGNPEIVKELINFGADVSARTENGSTPLHCAVFDVTYDKREILFDKLTRTKLDHAQILKQDEVVSILLNAGADINALNNEFKSPLFCAARRNHLLLTKRLLASGAQVDLLDDKGRSALHYAARQSSPEIVRILLNNGANVNLLSSEMATPLHCAVEGKNRKVISMLIQAGADISIKTYMGYPLHFFVDSKDATLLHLLLECGTDINAQDAVRGCTFLHNPLSLSDEVIAILMELHLNFNIEDNFKRTALEHYINGTFKSQELNPLIVLMAKMESDGKLTIIRRNRKIILDLFPKCYQQCKDELHNLKVRKVWGQTTFYDLLSKSLNDLAVYIRNKDLLGILDSGACEQFEIYGKFIEIRMRMALTRKQLLDKCLTVITKLLSPKRGMKLPRFFGLDVLHHLNAVDLENLADA